MEKGGAVYLLTNKNKTVLYTGVTSDLLSRVYDHRNKKYKNSFTAKYNVGVLVHYETFHSIEEAITREKQIKAGSGNKKEELINSSNPEWKDLYEEIMEW